MSGQTDKPPKSNKTLGRPTEITAWTLDQKVINVVSRVGEDPGNEIER